jgi:hypothetical protein
MDLMVNAKRPRVGATAITALALAVSGCITPGSQQVKLGTEQLLASTNAVTSLAELEYGPAPMADPIKFSLIKGFRLPKWAGSYSLSIVSHRLGTPSDPAVFYPDVRLLDDQYREIRALPASAYSLRAIRSGEAITATMFINNIDKGESLLVVSERDINDAGLEKTQQNVTTQSQVTVYGARGAMIMWMIPVGISSPPVQMLASPVGKLELVFEPYRPQKVGESGK